MKIVRINEKYGNYVNCENYEKYENHKTCENYNSMKMRIIRISTIELSY